MDESKDEGKGVSVDESIVTVKTVVTSTETLVKEVVEGEESRERVGLSEKVEVEEEEEGCDEGDVMVEILGSDVFVDGVRDEVSGDMDRTNEDGGGGSGGGESGICRDDGLDSEAELSHQFIRETGDGDELGKKLSSSEAEVKSNEVGYEAQESMVSVRLRANGDNDVSVEGCVETVNDSNYMDGSCEVTESMLSQQDIVEEGDELIVEEVNADKQGNELRDGKVNGGMQPINVDKGTCMDSVQSSAMSSSGPENIVIVEAMQESSLPGQVAGTEVSCEPDDSVVSDSVNCDFEVSNPELSGMQTQAIIGAQFTDDNKCIPVLDPYILNSGEKIEENLSLDKDQTSIFDGVGHGNGLVHEIESFKTPRETNDVCCSPAHLENQLDDKLLEVSVNNASPNNHETNKLLEVSTFESRADQLLQDEIFIPVDPLTKENEITKLSVHTASAEDTGPQVGSNAKDIVEVPYDSHPQAAGVDNFALAEPNIDETVEDFANAEEAVCVGETLQEKKTSELLNQVASADADIQEVVCTMNVDPCGGPFIVETEDPDESIAGSADSDVDSDPMHDENTGSHGHYSDKQLPFPVHPLVEGLQGAEDQAVEVDSDMEDAQEVLEEDSNEQVDSPDEGEAEEEQVSDLAKPQMKDERSSRRGHSKAESLSKDHRISYQLPPDIEGEFSVFDLVWGKVKSHPWWPGQIFHPSDSSEKAMKYYRKDCYLVAYFGDRTFAWNEASVLKPFRTQFAVAERQNRTEAFQNAVSCALEEVGRRTELGLACSCISEEAYDKIRYQIVENTGIREESTKREGIDRCTGVDFFQPGMFVKYVKSLAVSPTSGVDRLDFVIAKAQLLAFHRLRGTDALADFQDYDGLIEHESDVHSGHIETSRKIGHENSVATFDSKSNLKGPKRKHNLRDIVYHRRKEKSMTELMGETMYYLDGEFDSHEEDDNMLTSPTSSTKRKASGFHMDDFTSNPNTKTIALAKVSQSVSSNPQQSFKVGDCIRRVASQLTGTPANARCSNDRSINKHLADEADEVKAPNESQNEMSPSPSEQSSVDEMLSQLYLTARDPKKGYSFLGDIISFFCEFRVSAILTQRQQLRKGARKRKSSAPLVRPPEAFEFDDRNDSYWTDMVVQNNPEAKPSRRVRKRKDEEGAADLEKPPKSNLRKNRKQYFHGNLGSTETSLTEEKNLGDLPAELILSFSDMGSIPSEININKMFRRFGPLKESETKKDTQSSRARVVYKKRSDAEVAYSSAAMFNVFGSRKVSYQLNYVPSDSFCTVSPLLTEHQENAT